MSASLPAKNVISGTHGRLSWDGVQIAEVTACEAKIIFDREDVQMSGDFFVDSKIVGVRGEGSFTLKKVLSRFAPLYELMKRGQEVQSVLVFTLDDPDQYGGGKESYVCAEVKLNEAMLAGFEMNSIVNQEFPFRFNPENSYYIDIIV